MEIMNRQEMVLKFLREHGISFDCYNHPEGKTIEEIIKQDSEKKYPAPQPLFPPHGILDFDWSIIEDPPTNYNKRVLDLGK